VERTRKKNGCDRRSESVGAAQVQVDVGDFFGSGGTDDDLDPFGAVAAKAGLRVVGSGAGKVPDLAAAAVVPGVGDSDSAAVDRHHRLVRADTVKPHG